MDTQIRKVQKESTQPVQARIPRSLYKEIKGTGDCITDIVVVAFKEHLRRRKISSTLKSRSGDRNARGKV